MYITCSKCSTDFVVSDTEIGPYGRKVKCSKCQNIWHQNPKDPIRLEPSISKPLYNANKNLSSEAGINLPAIIPVPTYSSWITFVFSILIIILSIILFQNILGISPCNNSNAYKIEDLKVGMNEDLQKVSVSYKITNYSDKKLNVPLMRVQLLDNKNHVLKSYIINKKKFSLAPKQYIDINTEFASFPETKNVSITLGNVLDFILQ